MKKLILTIGGFKTPDFACASSAVMGTWLRVALHCADEMNGGRLVGAEKWTDTGWRKLIGVSRLEVADLIDAKLGGWDAQDLVIAGYPLHEEDSYKRQSAGGKKGMASRYSAVPSKEVSKVLITPLLRGNSILSHSLQEGEMQERETQQGGSQDPFRDLPKSATTHPVPPAPPRSFSDWLMMHARVFVSRDDRSDWEALYRHAGWQPMAEAHKSILGSLAAGKSMFFTQVRDYIATNYEEDTNGAQAQG